MRKGVSCWIKSYEGDLEGIESPFSEAEAQANMVMALTVVTASSRASTSAHYLSEKLSESFTFNGDVKKCKTANTQQKHPRAKYILKEKHRLKTIIIISWKINWDPNLKCSRPPPLIFSSVIHGPMQIHKKELLPLLLLIRRFIWHFLTREHLHWTSPHSGIKKIQESQKVAIF